MQASLAAQLEKNPPVMWETWVRSLGWEDPLVGKISWLGRSLGEGNSYPLQFSCLENSMDRGTWGRKEADMTKQLTGK